MRGVVLALLREDAAVAGGVLAAAGWLAGASVPEAVALFLLLCVLVEVCVADEVDCAVSAAAVLVSLVAFLLLFFFVDFAAVSVAVD